MVVSACRRLAIAKAFAPSLIIACSGRRCIKRMRPVTRIAAVVRCWSPVRWRGWFGGQEQAALAAHGQDLAPEADQPVLAGVGPLAVELLEVGDAGGLLGGQVLVGECRRGQQGSGGSEQSDEGLHVDLSVVGGWVKFSSGGL